MIVSEPTTRLNPAVQEEDLTLLGARTPRKDLQGKVTLP